MIEIFILFRATKSLAGTCREKNRSTGWAALFPVLWILGEIGGAVFAASGRGGTDATIYLTAMGCAVVGGIIGFVVVKSLKEVPLDTGLPQARMLPPNYPPRAM